MIIKVSCKLPISAQIHEYPLILGAGIIDEQKQS